jgi:hypothetical protein
MTPIKPCPFCGAEGETLIRGHRYPEGSSEKEPAVWCPTCDCKGPLKSWNTRATLTTPAPGRDELRERIALEIWHRWAENGTIEWEDETHKAEYLMCADAILSELPVAPVVDEANVELLDALIAADGLLQELGHSLPQVKAAIRAGGGER